MADDERPPPFLKRWSQRKLAASREPAVPLDNAASNVAPAPAVAQPSSEPVAAAAPPSLPPIESLSFDSDFSAFLRPNVDESLKRQALRKLFTDPRFNVMDGLDTYIDDYGKFEPLPPELVAQLNHAKFLFDPPKTRVNEHGHVEDVPEGEAAEPERTEAHADLPAVAEPAPIADDTTNVPITEAAEPRVLLSVPPAAKETQ